VYIGPLRLENNQLGETAIQIDDALIEEVGSIRTVMYRKYLEQPRLIVSIRADETSEMGVVTDVQQELREAGTLRINYSSRPELSN
jgi:biopolymer transport protein ExbD